MSPVIIFLSELWISLLGFCLFFWRGWYHCGLLSLTQVSTVWQALGLQRYNITLLPSLKPLWFPPWSAFRWAIVIDPHYFSFPSLSSGLEDVFSMCLYYRRFLLNVCFLLWSQLLCIFVTATLQSDFSATHGGGSWRCSHECDCWVISPRVWSIDLKFHILAVPMIMCCRLLTCCWNFPWVPVEN